MSYFLGIQLKTWLGIITSIAISLVLASRNLYIAIDDEAYVTYFTFFNDPFLKLKDGWWSFVLDEPLWALYTSFIGSVFGAETALRITIFISSLMFLVASGNLTRGAWLFVFCTFIIDDVLAPQMYFNQLRQGFALSIFLTIIAIGLSPFWGAVTALLVHSSFLLVAPILLMSLMTVKFNVNRILVIIIAILSVFLIKNMASDIDLGRRSNEYELKSNLTIFYYLIEIFQYGPVFLFFFSKKYFYEKTQLFWLNFSLVSFLFTMGLTFIHEASARMIYIANAFMMIVIGQNLYRKQVKIIALLWLLMLMALNIHEAPKKKFLKDSFFDRWSEILNIK
jgi:hypothetical protein